MWESFASVGVPSGAMQGSFAPEGAPCMIGIVQILVEGASKIIGSLGKPWAPEDRLTV